MNMNLTFDHCSKLNLMYKTQTDRQINKDRNMLLSTLFSENFNLYLPLNVKIPSFYAHTKQQIRFLHA